jgi:hypothetical protein
VPSSFRNDVVTTILPSLAQWRCILNSEAHIELRVDLIFSDGFKRRRKVHTGVGEHDVNATELFADLADDAFDCGERVVAQPDRSSLRAKREISRQARECHIRNAADTRQGRKKGMKGIPPSPFLPALASALGLAGLAGASSSRSLLLRSSLADGA